jgi:hypothetical protein
MTNPTTSVAFGIFPFKDPMPGKTTKATSEKKEELKKN